MAVHKRGSSCHYSISNQWIERNQGNTSAYFDIGEVARSTQTNIVSQYLSDMIAAGLMTTADVDREAMRANFIVDAIMVGEAGELRGWLADDQFVSREPWNFTVNVRHEMVFRRIYAHDTRARDIRILGFKGNV